MEIVAPEAALCAYLVGNRGRGVGVPDDQCVDRGALLGVRQRLRKAGHVDRPGSWQLEVGRLLEVDRDVVETASGLGQYPTANAAEIARDGSENDDRSIRSSRTAVTLESETHTDCRGARSDHAIGKPLHLGDVEPTNLGSASSVPVGKAHT